MIINLWQRYRQAWQDAWRQRKANDTPHRQPHEVQFLPAALALQDNPPHPTPRLFAWSVTLFTIVALAWSCLGRMDVVAVGAGKLVPSGRSKVIQPSDTAQVKAIHVHDGQAVEAGDLLLELDPTNAGADLRNSQAQLLAARLDALRSEAMLQAIETDAPPAPLAGDGDDTLSPQHYREVNRWLSGQYQEYRSGLAMIEAQLQQRGAEIQAASAQVDSLSRSLPIATRLAEDYRKLLAQQFVAHHEYLAKEQARLDLLRQLQVHRANLRQASAAEEEAQRRHTSLKAQTRRAMLDLQQDARNRIATFEKDLAKARHQHALSQLRAPVAGTVQELTVHTIGGVVTPAQTLMVIVPDSHRVEVEALLQNKDVGFVRPGQPVTVKVETFTYTRYGTLPGEVTHVSRDAIEDPKRGLVYSARIRLERDHVTINGQAVQLTPGMAVSAEIKTDRRRIISYFLGPLQRYRDESLLER